MKLFAFLAGISGLLVLLVIPMLFAGGDVAPTTCGTTAGSTDAVLATIRQLESGGDYQARAAGSSASGAYQFLDTTWDGYGGYPAAWLAPPAVQDAKATAYVTAILDAHGDDVTTVPVVWYLGHVPTAGSLEWDTVPAPSAGNTLTPRQYQTRWMATFKNQLATAPPRTPPSTTTLGTRAPDANAKVTSSTAARSSTASCTGAQSIEPLPGGWSLPGPRELLGKNPAAMNSPHHDFPAWDWPIPEHTPIYAVRGGHVDAIYTFPYNWWTHGCDTNSSGCVDCGTGVTITDDQGAQWTYCHASSLYIQAGDTITAGTQILASGNTGASTGPHVHLQITADGALRCPQPLIRSLYYDSTGLDPSTLPTSGCTD